MKNLEEKIAASTGKLAVHLGDSLHSDLKHIMNEQSEKIQQQYKEGTLHRLFWDQQLEVMSKYPTQCRWHPMLLC